jgi:ATP-binding cassette, subfamily C, bacterial CydD
MKQRRQLARAWTRAQAKAGKAASMRVASFGLLGVMLSLAQAWCIAALLAAGLQRQSLPARFPWGLAIAFAAAALLRAGLNLAADRAAQRAGAAARMRLRADALARLLAAGPALLREGMVADWAATLVDRIEAMDGYFARWLPAQTLALAGPLLVLIVALIADPPAALVLFIAGLLVPIGMAAAGIGAAAASRAQFLALARLQSRFLDRVRGIGTIVLAGAAEREEAALARAAGELRARTMRVLRVAFLSSAVLDLAAAGAIVVLALRAGFVASPSGGPTAVGLFALLLVPEFFAPLRAYALAYQDQLHATGAAEALVDLPPLPEPGPPLPLRSVAAHGVSIGFEDVCFAWDEARGLALDHLSFRLPAGEVLILVGPSGAGKSTVLEILLGFIRPQSGRVLINGAPIESIVSSALAGMLAWIGQKPVIFAGSIEENIRFGRPDASESDLANAVRAARLGPVIDALPHGLQTQVGEGGHGLSGGQAQRVAIARAFLKNAPILLLDEPTAHLDPVTEGEVLDSLRRLAVGRTVILASHSAAAHAFPGRRLDLAHGRTAGAVKAGSAA